MASSPSSSSSHHSGASEKYGSASSSAANLDVDQVEVEVDQGVTSKEDSRKNGKGKGKASPESEDEDEDEDEEEEEEGVNQDVEEDDGTEGQQKEEGDDDEINQDPDDEDEGAQATFESLGLIPQICEACALVNYKAPTNIQRETIPYALQGKDIIGLAQTGSGKTAAFALPIIQALYENPQPLFACVLAPTRELAYQISEQFTALGSTIGVRCAVIVGGMDMMQQSIALSKRPHVIVATPGRLQDHLENTKGFSLRNLKYLVGRPVPWAHTPHTFTFQSALNRSPPIHHSPRDILFCKSPVSPLPATIRSWTRPIDS